MSQTLTQELINRFNQEKILYCHWKSNIDLAKTFEGKIDIDLLVSNSSLARATIILTNLGFKSATSKWAKNPPGIFHFFGYDPNQKDLVHLHMFTRVLTGESFLKSHLLPFEEMLLQKTYTVNGLAVTSKEAELILFVLRTCIKYGSFLDAVRLLKSDKKLQAEAQWLKNGSNAEQVAMLLDKYCPVISDEIFNKFLNAILTRAPFLKMWSGSRQIRKNLQIYRKYSFSGWLSGYFQFLTGTLDKRFRKQKGSKLLLSGGTVIAIVGADATGKSTLVSETSRWLRKNFVVNTVHAGKPPSTFVTLPINFLLFWQRWIRSKLRTDRSSEKFMTSGVDNSEIENTRTKSLLYAARAVCLAWDRRALLLKTRQASANGEIIVCDRYPTSATGMMDSPRLLEDRSKKGITASIHNWLARGEQFLYRQIPPPDIVLRLSVSLEIAKKRNAAREVVDDEIYLQNRHQQAKEWFMPGTRLIQDIDTDLPLDETLNSVKRAIWASL